MNDLRYKQLAVFLVNLAWSNIVDILNTQNIKYFMYFLPKNMPAKHKPIKIASVFGGLGQYWTNFSKPVPFYPRHQ